MYKNPELSAMAKTLVDELSQEGLELKYTKALSIAAKMMGARNLHEYQAQSAVVEKVSQDDILFEGSIKDWNFEEAKEAGFRNPLQKRSFNAKVERHGSQLFVDIAMAHKKPEDIDNTDQLSLFIEIHEGRPRVLLSNQLYGDQVLGVYGLAGGLLLEPMTSNEYIRSGIPQESSILALYEEEQARGGTQSIHNWMFMEKPNRYD